MDADRLAAFAERLRKEVRTRFKTRLAFCAAAGITRTTLRQLERGTQHPSPATLTKLADALHLPVDVLTGTPHVDPGSPLLADLTEDDLRVAQLFHHAGLTVKQRVLGVLQERQVPHRQTRDLSADVQTWASRLLALPPDQRYLAAALIADLEGATPVTAADVTAATIDLARRIQSLTSEDRAMLARAVPILDALHARQTTTKTKGPRTP